VCGALRASALLLLRHALLCGAQSLIPSRNRATQHAQLVSVATCYGQQGDWWRAIECFTKCLQAIKDSAPSEEGPRYSDPTLACAVLCQMAPCFERVAKYRRALECYAQAEDVGLAHGAHTAILLQSCLARGILHFKLGNFTPSLGPIILEPDLVQGSSVSQGALSPRAADYEQALSREQHLASALQALTRAVAYQKQEQEEGSYHCRQMQSSSIVCGPAHGAHDILMW
jgi:tetratricopeptide (TPR) repeat protein